MFQDINYTKILLRPIKIFPNQKKINKFASFLQNIRYGFVVMFVDVYISNDVFTVLLRCL